MQCNWLKYYNWLKWGTKNILCHRSTLEKFETMQPRTQPLPGRLTCQELKSRLLMCFSRAPSCDCDYGLVLPPHPCNVAQRQIFWNKKGRIGFMLGQDWFNKGILLNLRFTSKMSLMVKRSIQKREKVSFLLSQLGYANTTPIHQSSSLCDQSG